MNLKSLAIALGMSKTTVSRALNGYPEVNSRTREKVVALAKKVGYRANPMARSLAVGRTNVVGMIVPMSPGDLGDAMMLALVGGMSERLEASKMNLMLAPVSPSNELAMYEQWINGRQVDGMVLAHTQVTDARVACLSCAAFPFIVHGRTRLDAPYAWFDYDDDSGMRLALERLMQLGHQRIALIGAPPALNFAQQRRDSFLRIMALGGLAVDPRYLIADAQERRGGYRAMQQLLACSPRPSAVIVDNHLSGVGAVRALIDAGLVLGRDMSVIVWGSVEDTLIGSNVTTVDLPEPRLAGAKMVDMLQALLAGKPAQELQVLWQPVLLPGATVGRCPA